MVTRMGHMTLRVPDVGAAVAFSEEVLGLREVERIDGTSYLTCNDRHHELAIAPGKKAAYGSIGLEVENADALEATLAAAETAGGKRLGAVEEPAVEGAALVEGPGGHVFRLFHGMATGQPEEYETRGVRPLRPEHVSLNVRNRPKMEAFLENGLGFEFSDRIGGAGSWWRCEAIHHGVALVRTPKNGLAHYAFALRDFDDFRAIGDRLHERGMKLCWGPGRHGPGNNLFIYFFDAAGILVECCVDMAEVGPGRDYTPQRWKLRPGNISLWGGVPPPKFLAADAPCAAPE
ncbi:MAG: catechol 2,3-dioxygenase [Thermoleophilaceae bacterium]|nr:catechol 2,3-dioxygenase [Thermoleophilaceae bacterium]